MDLVLNTLGASVDDSVIRALLPAKDAEIVDTSDMKIAHCTGCNQCWLRTPGVCAIRDDYEAIVRKLVGTGDFWIVSGTRFGFLDSRGKRLLDRILPMLNMYIGFRDGWMRHELRYHALNVGVLYQGAGDRELLEDWCRRTAANLGGHSLGAIALGGSSGQTVCRADREITPAEPVSSRHLVIINGSPRVQKFSNTDKIIHSFAKGLKAVGMTTELHNLSRRAEWDAAREAFLTRDRILFALPLYVECVPGLMLEFLETLPAERKTPGQLSFLLHGGMDEGNEFRLCERFLRSLAAQLGCIYGGTLVRGGSFRIRTTDGNMRARMVAPFERMGRLYAKKGSFLTPEAAGFTGPEQYPWLFRRMVSLLFIEKVNRSFDEFAAGWGCTRPLDDKPYQTQPCGENPALPAHVADDLNI